MREIKTKEQLAAFSSRLNKLLDEEGYSKQLEARQKELSSEMGTTPRGARKWLMGEGLPDTKKLEKLASVCKCGLDWLLSGTGSMRPSKNRKAQAVKLNSQNANKLIRHITTVDESIAGGLPNWATEIITTTLKQVEKTKS